MLHFGLLLALGCRSTKSSVWGDHTDRATTHVVWLLGLADELEDEDGSKNLQLAVSRDLVPGRKGSLRIDGCKGQVSCQLSWEGDASSAEGVAQRRKHANPPMLDLSCTEPHQRLITHLASEVERVPELKVGFFIETIGEHCITQRAHDWAFAWARRGTATLDCTCTIDLPSSCWLTHTGQANQHKSNCAHCHQAEKKYWELQQPTFDKSNSDA
mmetsp:Transcript_130881/g.213067  ORF Transcript_130881/g.213067 Transcript_130881/m.213067 type:complete len:214 (-) Transcript_130881:25-666(-)